MRGFPDVFKNRWNSVYQFFHEGNPSTVLVRTIINARKTFLKINILIGFFKGELIYEMANDAWAEFFIGIGEDQNEISYAKSKFMELDPQNAAVFWGNPTKLLPNIPNNSIDNFIINMPKSTELEILTNSSSLSSLISTISIKMINTGTLQIVTDIPKGGDLFNTLYKEILSKGFVECPEDSKSYFSKLDLASLSYYSDPYLLLFCLQQPS